MEVYFLLGYSIGFLSFPVMCILDDLLTRYILPFFKKKDLNKFINNKYYKYGKLKHIYGKVFSLDNKRFIVFNRRATKEEIDKITKA